MTETLLALDRIWNPTRASNRPRARFFGASDGFSESDHPRDGSGKFAFGGGGGSEHRVDRHADPTKVEPVNQVDFDKVEAIAERMKSGGWQGRPVLAYEGAQGTTAVTGSHRLAAAEMAGIDVPLMDIDEDALNYTDEDGNVLSDFVGTGDDRNLAKFLREAGDEKAAELVQAEIDANLEEWGQDARRALFAFDRASVRTKDPKTGHLHVARTPISKANVCPYYGREIPKFEDLGLDPDKVYKLYRHPDELKKAAPTFNGKPLLFGHKPVHADDHPRLITVGAVTAPEWDDPLLYAALDIWPSEAIDAIESGDNEQLSAAYNYDADMTAGVTPESERYDGVMRNIHGNHIAMVPEGRAGPDMVVLDEALIIAMEIITMAGKTAALSRPAFAARVALDAYLRPKLAKGIALDSASFVSCVTGPKTFRAQLPAIIAAIKIKTAGKLAQDATVDDLAEVLEAIAPILEAEPEAAAVDDDDPDAMDDDDAQLRTMLKAKGMSDADIDKICAMTSGAADADKDDKDKKDAEMKTAQDAAIAAAVAKATKDMVSATAMDAKLRETAASIRADQIAIAEARSFVEPYAGKLPIAMDSVEAVHRAALDVMGVKHDGKHPDALRDIIEAQPLPGSPRQGKPPRIATDSAKGAEAEFATMFPGVKPLVRI